MKNIFCALLLATCVPLVAQDTLHTDKKKIQYFFTFNSGMLAGDHGKSITYTANTVHGITLGKRLKVGAGIGFDGYSQWMTMPLFGQVYYDLDDNKNGVFVQVNYGWAHAWAQKEEGAPDTAERGGQMFNPMLGYKIASGKLKVYVAAGYKSQLASTQYEYFSPISSLYSPGYTQRVEQTLQRFVFTLGMGWN